MILIKGVESEDVGLMAKERDIAIFELTPIRPSLEDLFVKLTADRVEFQGQAVQNDRGEDSQ